MIFEKPNLDKMKIALGRRAPEGEDVRKAMAQAMAQARIPRQYTRDEMDRLFCEVERSVINDRAIDLHKIEDILLPGDFTLSGVSASVDIEMFFEIKGLRWEYEDEIYSALISPCVRFRHIPCVEWCVTMTMCESGKNAGTCCKRTHMLAKNYRVYNACAVNEVAE